MPATGIFKHLDPKKTEILTESILITRLNKGDYSVWRRQFYSGDSFIPASA